ncbi:MAG: ribonuclease G [Patescibacteria group bacterium]
MLNHPEIRKFNWSAFSDSIFWGIGNKCYITLLTLIPFFGIVWMFVCGFKGNQWVWENGEYKTIEEFKMVQDTWNRAGLARFIYNIVIRFFIFFLVYLLIFFFIGVMAGMEEYMYESYWY